MRNDQFKIEYDNVINKFSGEFINRFCDKNGKILWEEVMNYNSSDEAI